MELALLSIFCSYTLKDFLHPIILKNFFNFSAFCLVAISSVCWFLVSFFLFAGLFLKVNVIALAQVTMKLVTFKAGS